MAIVKGTLKVRTEVDIEPLELIKGLYRTFGLYSSQEFPDLDLRVEEIDNKEVLVEYWDIAHHGSPCWDKTNRIITEPHKVRAYKYIQELEKLIKCSINNK